MVSGVFVCGVAMVAMLLVTPSASGAEEAIPDWRTPDPESVSRDTAEIAAERAAMTELFIHESAAAVELQHSAVGDRQPIEWTNFIGLRFRLIPAGEFAMGSPVSEEGRKKFDWCGDETMHHVTISQPFYMAVTETTQSQWQAVMGENPSQYAPGGTRGDEVAGLDTATFPTENVSWSDVQKFIAALNECDGELLRKTFGEGVVYALPTEAMWEYGIRGGTTTPFGIGGMLNGMQANMDGREPYGTDEPGPIMNHPTSVASYPPNAWGIYDGHGNVWEWCDDGWVNDLGPDAVTDPRTPTDGPLRVDRGGGFDNIPALCRAAHRGSYEQHRRSPYVGFRLVIRLPVSGTP